MMHFQTSLSEIWLCYGLHGNDHFGVIKNLGIAILQSNKNVR